MASISHDKKSGRRTIQFIDTDGKRKSIRLGKVNKRQADTVRNHIEKLMSAKITGHAVPDDTALWLARLDTDSKLVLDLAKYEFIDPPAPRHKKFEELGRFTDAYIDGRTDVKPATKEIWRQGRNGLVEFFDANRKLDTITAGEADDYRMHLIGRGLAPMTVRKRIQFAKTIFRSAFRHGVIASNPFEDVKVKATMPDRQYFVSRSDTERLINACPDLDWRLIVSLARYGGLRCPSEVLSLQLDHIDWERDRILVTSPKTEHHPGRESRLIPLFPELREVLGEALECADDGAIFVVDERYRRTANTSQGWRNINLRTTFQKIVRRAGLEPWPRLFHNLRSTRETELVDEYPIHVVAEWMGHTTDIAMKHYTQTTQEHFAKAVQYSAAMGRKGSQGKEALVEKPLELQGDAALCEAVQFKEADGEGFEPPVRVSTYSSFQDCRLRPLGHPSGVKALNLTKNPNLFKGSCNEK